MWQKITLELISSWNSLHTILKPDRVALIHYCSTFEELEKLIDFWATFWAKIAHFWCWNLTTRWKINLQVDFKLKQTSHATIYFISTFGWVVKLNKSWKKVDFIFRGFLTIFAKILWQIWKLEKIYFLRFSQGVKNSSGVDFKLKPTSYDPLSPTFCYYSLLLNFWRTWKVDWFLSQNRLFWVLKLDYTVKKITFKLISSWNSLLTMPKAPRFALLVFGWTFEELEKLNEIFSRNCIHYARWFFQRAKIVWRI